MTAFAAALTRTWKIGRYTATLTVPPLDGCIVHAVIEWEPHVPNDLTADELQSYRAGCNAAFAELGLLSAIVETNAQSGVKGK
ncbi:MAG: hypothetical protein IV107_03915 [Paucibacter sp.]|nr:hypothetical protein [Roseateles sp.]